MPESGAVDCTITAFRGFGTATTRAGDRSKQGWCGLLIAARAKPIEATQ